MNHPDSEQLNAYVQDPGADQYRQLRLHLLGCASCRAEVGLLAELKADLPEIEAQQYRQMLSRDEALNSLLHTQLIEEYVDGRLADEEQQRIAGMLQDNGQAMKAALHYASHSAGMQREWGDATGRLQQPQTELQTGRGQVASPGLLGLLRQWLTIRTPAWLAVPVSAAAAAALTVTLLPRMGSLAKIDTVVAYQDNPVIQFKQAHDLPGIGFFSNANKTAKPYARIHATLPDAQTIRLAWPEVKDAVSYTIHLKIFDKGRQVSVGQVTTTSSQASFRRAPQDIGHRYVWSLNGKTRSGQLFATKGGFVIYSEND